MKELQEQFMNLTFILKLSYICNISGQSLFASRSEDDVVDGDEDELNDVADEANHDETHGASLQDFHVF